MKKILKKMKVLGKAVNLGRHIVLGKEGRASLVFGQQHTETQEYFLKRFGVVHTIPFDQTPHVRFLAGHLAGNPGYEEEYDKYLKISWAYYRPDKNTSDERAKKIRKFLALFESAKKRGKLDHRLLGTMVQVCQRPDGKLILVDGNHRASVAHLLDQPLRVYRLDPTEHLMNLTTVPDEFYGSKRLNMPYQSLFLGEKELLRGRRPDLLERIKMIRREDLEGKSVLEIGCNIGGNCFLAAQQGARDVRGLELSANLVTSAIRVNNYLTQPCLFYRWDLNNVVEGFAPADTVFCFSVTKHVPNQEAVAESLKRLTGKVLYFEGHAKSDYSEYKHLIDPAHFHEPVFLGYLRDGIHTEKRTRMLWRIEVKN